jgi:uncharacterized membrane protein YfcA
MTHGHAPAADAASARWQIQHSTLEPEWEGCAEDATLLLEHASFGGIDTRRLAWTGAGSAGGAALGAWLMSARLRSRQVKVLIGCVLLAIAARISWGLL